MCFILQTAELVGVSDETCWDFVATQIAPLSVVSSLNVDTPIGHSDADSVMEQFIDVLANGLSTVSRTNVSQQGLVLNHL